MAKTHNKSAKTKNPIWKEKTNCLECQGRLMALCCKCRVKKNVLKLSKTPQFFFSVLENKWLW